MGYGADAVNTQLTAYIQTTLYNYGVEQSTCREKIKGIGIENTYIKAGGKKFLPRCGSVRQARSCWVSDAVLNSHRGSGILFCFGLMGDLSPERILLVDADRLADAGSDEEISWPEVGRVGKLTQQGKGFYFDRLMKLGKTLAEEFNG